MQKTEVRHELGKPPHRFGGTLTDWRELHMNGNGYPFIFVTRPREGNEIKRRGMRQIPLRRRGGAARCGIGLVSWLLFVFALAVLMNSCLGPGGIIAGVETGNETNNTVFLFNLVCEDKDYVYVSGYAEGGEGNIKRIGKADGSVTELDQKGQSLNLYGGYLYFYHAKNLYTHGLYRISFEDLDGEPEFVVQGIRERYTIFDGKIYPLDMYCPIFRLNVDGSDVEKTEPAGDYYYIHGTDGKYIYTIFKDIEKKVIDGVRTNVYHFSRMDHSGENRERLFEIYTDEWTGLGMNNDFLVVSNGYAYYKMRYDGRDEIIRNKLVANSKREVVYTVPEDQIVIMIAVTGDGIYFLRYDRGNPPYDCGLVPNVKLSLDGKTETPIDIAAGKTGLPLSFVSRYDGKLYYISDDRIIAVP